MITCRLCGAETDMPCGPIRGEVCPSCWLAVGDDWLCEYTPDLEAAVELIESQKSMMTELQFLMATPDSLIFNLTKQGPQ